MHTNIGPVATVESLHGNFEGPVTGRRAIYGKRFTAMVTWEL